MISANIISVISEMVCEHIIKTAGWGLTPLRLDPKRSSSNQTYSGPRRLSLMAVYRTADGDEITVETHSRGIVISSDLRLTTHLDPPGTAAARGDLVTGSPVSAFEDIFHDDLQFDIDVEPKSAARRNLRAVWRSVVAHRVLSGSAPRYIRRSENSR